MKDYEPGLSFATAESAALHDARGDEDAAVTFLRRRAGDGPALELAIGTGRIALPLAERGIRVDGIDIAPAMVARLREKPGGDRLSVQIGDFADVDVPGRYPLVFVVWNSFFNLLSQDDQVRCFRNVAGHLTDDGVFVIEAYVPGYLYALQDHQQVQAETIDVDETRLGVLRHDGSRQLLEQSHVTLSTSGIRMNPVVQRYAWPSEIDLMARLAGLRLHERWGGWGETPYDADARLHVSVYGR